MFQVFEVDPVILNADQLMYHSLVSPLVQKRSHRVFLPVGDQQVRRWRIT